ncbi:hypothetical protein DEAC_c43440 [Desulfosporosinus acididurans]|uniref:Uncharacterized protein n=1 Tax=Desulfosporosinus acididurans TaxID=476652 RepID=A0A0J1IG75_9FIRM|nr:hypothetical protein [Desulfosporosinus acididurans]KLU63741.1 hypothetical protein DEAC_c43440 [Desulfosporosinus acididurans]
MKKHLMSILLFTVLSLVALSGCSNSKTNVSFTSIADGLAKNVNQLYKQPGITHVGFSSDPEKELFKIGLAIDHQKIANGDLQQTIQSYLKDSASFTSEPDPNKLLKPYQLQIEEIVKDSNTTKLIAVKPSGSTDISWK